ncbi:MAG TPA: alpha/beta hydrolase [Kofleriaceae bacterium]|nr:alpha/beta hydrolase [Kofleriaceae bacterium]
MMKVALVLIALAACTHPSTVTAPSARIERNVEFAPATTLDVYAPLNATSAPVIVWFHGGALVEGDKQDEAAIAARFAEAGFVTIVPNYRLSPGVAHPAHVQDAASAVAWSIAHARDYGGDSARMFVGGYSAGAYLAALLATDERYLAAHQQSPSALRGVILVSGFFWVERPGVAPDRPTSVWGADAGAWPDASPAHHLHDDMRPHLIIYADGDDEWRRQQNTEYAETLKSAGQLVMVHDRNHTTIHTTLSAPKNLVLRQLFDFVRRESQ